MNIQKGPYKLAFTAYYHLAKPTVKKIHKDSMKLHWRIYIRENKVMIIHANRTDKNSALYRILFITIRRIFSTYTWNLERLHTNLQAITHEIPNGYTRISKWLHMKFQTVTHEFPSGYTWNSERLHTNFQVVTHEIPIPTVTHEFPNGYTWNSAQLHMNFEEVTHEKPKYSIFWSHFEDPLFLDSLREL